MSRRTGSIAAVLPGLLLVMVLGAIDQTIMAPALPAVAAELGGLRQLPIVVTSYLVAATVVMPVYGKFGDRFGRKPLLQIAIVVFVAGAIGCAFVTTMPQLIAFRVLQGLGGGGLSIAAQAIIGELVSPRQRGRYLGLIGAAYTVAVVGGPLVGGLIIDQASWRWIFAIYPPLGIIALIVLTLTLRLPRPTARPPIDYAGVAALAVTVVGVVAGGQTRNPWWFAMAAVGAAAWLLTARYATDPVLPVRLFRDRAVAIPVLMSALIGFALFGTVTYLPSLLQVILGTSAVRAGLVVTAMMAGVLITTVASGRAITRTGRYRRYPIVGTAIAALGMSSLAIVGTEYGLIVIGAAMMLIGLGIGLIMQVMVLAAQNAVSHADLGTTTSTVTFLRQIGASVGVAVVGALLTWRIDPRLPAASAFSDAFGVVFGAMVPLLVIAFVLALILPARPLRTTAHVPVEPRAEARSHRS